MARSSVAVLDQVENKKHDQLEFFLSFDPPLKLSRESLKGKDIDLGDDLREMRSEGPAYDLRRPIHYAWVVFDRKSAAIYPVDSVDERYSEDVGALAYGFGVESETLGGFLKELGRKTQIEAPTWHDVFAKNAPQSYKAARQQANRRMQQQQQMQRQPPRVERYVTEEKANNQMLGGLVIGGFIGWIIGSAGSKG